MPIFNNYKPVNDTSGWHYGPKGTLHWYKDKANVGKEAPDISISPTNYDPKTGMISSMDILKVLDKNGKNVFIVGNTSNHHNFFDKMVKNDLYANTLHKYYQDEQLSIKKAAFNPALFADDALDAYVMYNANKPKQQRQYKSPAVRSPITKFAGFMDVLTSAATFTRNNPVTVAKAVAPFVAATGAGIAASMYAPFWAGGPNEGEEKVNKKRMLRNAVAYNSAMLYAPSVAPAFKDLTKAVESKDVLKTVGGLGNMAPAVATAYGAAKLLKNRGVGDKNLVNYFNRGESIKFVANLPGFLQRVSNFVESSMVSGGGI